MDAATPPPAAEEGAWCPGAWREEETDVPRPEEEEVVDVGEMEPRGRDEEESIWKER